MRSAKLLDVILICAVWIIIFSACSAVGGVLFDKPGITLFSFVGIEFGILLIGLFIMIYLKDTPPLDIIGMLFVAGAITMIVVTLEWYFTYHP